MGRLYTVMGEEADGLHAGIDSFCHRTDYHRYRKRSCEQGRAGRDGAWLGIGCTNFSELEHIDKHDNHAVRHVLILPLFAISNLFRE